MLILFLSDIVFSITACLWELQKCFVYFPLDLRNTWNEDSSVCHTGGFTLPNIHKRAEMAFIRKWMQALHMYTQMTRLGLTGDIENFQRFKNDIIMFYVYIGKIAPTRDTVEFICNIG